MVEFQGLAATEAVALQRLEREIELRRIRAPVAGVVGEAGELRFGSPPFRFIADLSDWNQSLGILVPGQSGHPASEHYDDNIKGFFKGEYHPMLFDREQVTSQTKFRLTLVP